MSTSKNVLYIGPYKEESNRGYYSYSNIKSIEKAGHNIKIIPRYCEKYLNNKLEDIKHLEETVLDNYDICIQHCINGEFVRHSAFDQNIGICDMSGFEPDPILNHGIFLLDKIIVDCKVKLKILQNTIPSILFNKVRYQPHLLDLDDITNSSMTDSYEWIDKDRFYFYSELNFTSQYDWEKLIYVYLNSFMNSNTGLILKTNNLPEDKAQLLIEDMKNIAIDSRIKLNKNNFPQIINSVLSKEDSMKLYNSVDCIIDTNKTNESSYTVLKLAAMGKDVICNTKLTTASYLNSSLRVDAMLCNSQTAYYNDITNNSIYNYYYSMDTNSLRNKMLLSYNSRHNKNSSTQQEMTDYNMTNDNTIIK